MRRLFSTFLVTTVTLLSLNQTAKAFDVAAVGVGNLTMPVANSNGIPVAGYVAELGVGFGALVGVDIASVIGIEAGILYTPRHYGTGLVDTTFTMLEYPILLRFTPLPIVSFAAGGYLANAIGNYNSYQVSTGLNTSKDYTLSGFSTFDFGLLASVALQLPIAPTLDILADLRYYLGLQNCLVNQTTSGFFFRDLQLLLGLKLSL